MNVVTRFAPSPTGMLHIGGARTALFNYLFAKHHGGTYKLRIEDTDKKRSTPEATQALLDGLQWLGVPHDGEPLFQSKRESRHREVAEELVGRGQAYYCYCSVEELAQQRAEAEAKGEVFKYDRRWRPGAPAGKNLQPPKGVKPSIRIMAPLEGEVVVKDAVQGDVRFAAGELDDFIILRGDGTPTYMHAVVVDDHDMGITHIIRGDDHLSNAGRQIIIYQAMGWDVPAFAHVPMIHGPDGSKLSKRHGATSVTEYAALGYLPEAMRNYLLRLGWSHGDDEIISDEDAIAWFDLEHIGQSPARLDFAKLDSINAHYLRGKDYETQTKLTIQPLEKKIGREITPKEQEMVFKAIVSGSSTRASTTYDLAGTVEFFIHPVPPDEKAQSILRQGKENLQLVISVLEALAEPWNEAAVKGAINQIVEQSGKKLGELMPPLRAAIVGAMSGQDIPVVMTIMGQEEVLKRLKAAAHA